MSQQQVMEFLEAHPKEWYCSKQIAQHIGASMSAISKNLQGIRKVKNNSFVYFEEYEPWRYKYKLKPTAIELVELREKRGLKNE